MKSETVSEKDWETISRSTIPGAKKCISETVEFITPPPFEYIKPSAPVAPKVEEEYVEVKADDQNVCKKKNCKFCKEGTCRHNPNNTDNKTTTLITKEYDPANTITFGYPDIDSKTEVIKDEKTGKTSVKFTPGLV